MQNKNNNFFFILGGSSGIVIYVQTELALCRFDFQKKFSLFRKIEPNLWVIAALLRPYEAIKNYCLMCFRNQHHYYLTPCNNFKNPYFSILFQNADSNAS